MLIATNELAGRRHDPKVAIFDCRHDLTDHAKGLAAYRGGHIPGAHFAPVETALAGAKTGRNGRHPLPRPEDFAGFLHAHGVTPETLVVAYDDAGGLYAARLWWMARWIGHERAALLDGGLPKWIAEGRPLATATLAARPAPAPRPGRAAAFATVSTDTIQSSLGGGELLVLDARMANRYRGETEPIDPVAGHIPGAANRFYKANLEADGTFRAPETLRREFAALLGGRAPAQVVHQCGSGITACANLFAMELAGLTGSRLYAGSWSEWVSDPSRPVERG